MAREAAAAAVVAKLAMVVVAAAVSGGDSTGSRPGPLVEEDHVQEGLAVLLLRLLQQLINLILRIL